MTDLKTTTTMTADGDLIVSHSQDISAILDHNKDLRDQNTHSIKDEFRLEAVIPDIVILEWMKEGINFYTKEGRAAVKKKLNDPAYAYLRTSTRRL